MLSKRFLFVIPQSNHVKTYYKLDIGHATCFRRPVPLTWIFVLGEELLVGRVDLLHDAQQSPQSLALHAAIALFQGDRRSVHLGDLQAKVHVSLLKSIGH